MPDYHGGIRPWAGSGHVSQLGHFFLGHHSVCLQQGGAPGLDPHSLSCFVPPKGTFTPYLWCLLGPLTALCPTCNLQRPSSPSPLPGCR